MKLAIATFSGIRSNLSSVLRVLALFLSKSGAVIVGIIFLPLYHQLLGTELFGIVAVILSLQAFAVMVDFGMSVLVARDAAQLDSAAFAKSTILRNAEFSVIAAYTPVLLLVVLTCIATGLSVSQSAVAIGCVGLLLLTVLQNLGQTTLLARRNYFSASLVQVGGVTLRAAVTAAALKYCNSDLVTFITSQLLVTILHFAITRSCCSGHGMSEFIAEKYFLPTRSDIVNLLKRGGPLIISGLAGAAILQLDKPLLFAFVSPADMSPYFLAMTASALPASLLAAPVVQYFQPQVIRVLDESSSADPGKIISQFTFWLLLVVAIPSFILWQWAEPIMLLWLRVPEQAHLVAMYVKILMPAFALGSLCFVPFVLLMAVQDFKYQAVTSALLTIGALCLIAASATAKRIDLVCYAYLVYFTTASLSVWWRSLTLPATKALARLSATKTATSVLLLSFIAAVFAIRY